MCRRQLPLMLLFCVTIAGVARFATAHVHPAMERFMQRDPLEHVDGPNFYVYVRDNPIRLTCAVVSRSGAGTRLVAEARAGSVSVLPPGYGQARVGSTVNWGKLGFSGPILPQLRRRALYESATAPWSR
jgi:hypothetical protein